VRDLPSLTKSDSSSEADDDLREYDLDNYDSEPDASGEQPHGIFGNTTSLAYHTSNTEDPYITLKDDDASDSEREELQVLATDNMVLAARVEDEVAHLEVYVYEDEDDNLYVHHDIMLPAIPLCVEWLSIGAGKNASGAAVDQSANANYVAVGTMDPDIEIWDLDTIDCMYPNAILGQGGEDNTMVTEAESGKKKKPRKKTKKANENYHVDAVLSLAANRNHRTLLASASADKTVKLWDLATCKCAQSYNYHTDKVCSLDWHPTDTATLLSGSYDRTVVVSEMRAPAANKPRWGVESDVEQVRWNPHDPNYFFVSTEDGYLHYHDIRTAPSTPEKSKPVWKLKAHDKALSSFDINPSIPNLLATGSQDKETKLWSLSGMGPSLVVGRNLGVGKVFSTTWAPDQEVGFRLAVAGSKGSVQVWDTSTNPAIRQAFSGKVKPIQGDVKERLVGIQEDSSDDSDDSEDDEDDDEGAGKDGWESMDED
jgi:periodic tryptophan protein 1